MSVISWWQPHTSSDWRDALITSFAIIGLSSNVLRLLLTLYRPSWRLEFYWLHFTLWLNLCMIVHLQCEWTALCHVAALCITTCMKATPKSSVHRTPSRRRICFRRKSAYLNNKVKSTISHLNQRHYGNDQWMIMLITDWVHTASFKDRDFETSCDYRWMQVL